LNETLLKVKKAR